MIPTQQWELLLKNLFLWTDCPKLYLFIFQSGPKTPFCLKNMSGFHLRLPCMVSDLKGNAQLLLLALMQILNTSNAWHSYQKGRTTSKQNFRRVGLPCTFVDPVIQVKVGWDWESVKKSQWWWTLEGVFWQFQLSLMFVFYFLKSEKTLFHRASNANTYFSLARDLLQTHLSTTGTFCKLVSSIHVASVYFFVVVTPNLSYSHLLAVWLEMAQWKKLALIKDLKASCTVPQDRGHLAL